MDEKQYDVEAVKTRLYEYRDIAKEIDSQSERLERLKAKMYGVGAQAITDMPRTPSPDFDRMAGLIQQKEELEKEIRRRFPEITWTSAKLEGTRLMIAVKENDAPILSQEEPGEAGQDLLSQYAGTVVSIIVRSGVPKVAAGDTVEAGSVLVEGKVPIYNEDATVKEYLYVDADADIVLEHTMEFTDELPFDYVRKEYTGREKSRYYVRFGDREWKMPQELPFLVYDSVIRESRPLILEKLSVPVYTGSYTYREYQNVEHTYTQEEAEEKLKEKLMVFLAGLEEKGIQIIEKDVRINTNASAWVISGQFVVRENVGESAATQKESGGETLK